MLFEENCHIDRGFRQFYRACRNTDAWAPRGNAVPASFRLEQNYPNPFNPTTNIRYQLHKPAQVSLRIYDAMGREVRTLVDRRIAAGVHQETWDGKDNASRPVSSGVYYYRLRADQIERAKRMTVVK